MMTLIRSWGVFNLSVLVAALGYFVDMFDLVLFGVVRVPSLMDLGIHGDAVLDLGMLLLNRQMLGMLVGGIFWGVLGDKLGRIGVLFGSILIYSLANIANAFVHSIDAYALLRFLAGFGLAGELGAAITLVSEILPQNKRGYGTAFVASVGLCGAVVASYVAGSMNWRTSYILGGCLGLLLLVLRFQMKEPALFLKIKEKNISRGQFFLLFKKRDLFLRYVSIILVGVPVWFVVGIVVTFSPEFAKELQVSGPVVAALSIFYTYVGSSLGDLTCGLLSQWLEGRKKAIGLFLSAMAILVTVMMSCSHLTPQSFYNLCGALGFASGFWAVFMTMAAELFGTNLRSTVATTVPNFVRGSIVPLTVFFEFLRPRVGLTESVLVLGGMCFGFAFCALFYLKETYGADLNFLET